MIGKRICFSFDRYMCIVCDQFGNPTGFDQTFNHQLWFASIASFYKEYDPEIATMVTQFLDCIDNNIVSKIS